MGLKLINIDKEMHVQMIHCAEQNSVTTPKFEETKITPSFFMLKKVPSINIKLPPKDLVTSLWTPFPEGPSINDVRVFGSFLPPPFPPNFQFLATYAQFWGVILDPPPPPKLGHYLWTFPDAKGHWATIKAPRSLPNMRYLEGRATCVALMDTLNGSNLFSKQFLLKIFQVDTRKNKSISQFI